MQSKFASHAFSKSCLALLASHTPLTKTMCGSEADVRKEE